MRISVPSDAVRPALPTSTGLIASVWSLEIAGQIEAPFLLLRPDGLVAGHGGSQITSWDRRDGALVFLDERGRISASFDREAGDGRLIGRTTDGRPCELAETTPAHAGERPFLKAELLRRRDGPRRPNLVILRANEASLHRSWAVDIDEHERSWDFCTSFYGAEASFPVDDFAEFTTLQRQERKFQAIRSLLLSHPALADYDYIMLPDDDIQMSWSDINATFYAMRRWRLELGQPSLHPSGVINYEATRQEARCHVRFVSMVEVMIPVFTGAALRACLPTFDLTRSSFGIDYAWSKILGGDPRAIGIIDDVAVTHTRPTASSYDIEVAYKEGDALSAQYGATEWFQVNVRGGIYR